jgi:hypothetical protein
VIALRPAPGAKAFIIAVFGGFAAVVATFAGLAKVWQQGIGQWLSALGLVIGFGAFPVLFCIRAGIWADDDVVIVVTPYGRRRSIPRASASRIVAQLNRTLITDDLGRPLLVYRGAPWRERDLIRFCEVTGLSPTVQTFRRRKDR